MNKIIECKNVSFEYRDGETVKNVINNLNLAFERGSFTVILGHNGSGKSTLAKLLNGLYKPDSGTVTVDGMCTADEANELEIKRRVGMVFQNPDNQLIASVVEDDVAFGPENLGLEPAQIRNRVDAALKAVEMFDYRTATPHRLSGGQKQRIAIAGMIAMQPECLVLDEPTAMLDPQGRSEIMQTLVRLNRNRHMTIILITHFMEEAALADRVVVLNDGLLLADGSPKKVFSDAASLKAVGLDVPQTTELLLRLKQNGSAIQTDGLDVMQTADLIADAFHLEEI